MELSVNLVIYLTKMIFAYKICKFPAVSYNSAFLIK
jgi:hypothetical protein